MFHRVQRIGFDGNLSNYADPVNGANSPNPVPAKRGLQKWRTVGAQEYSPTESIPQGLQRDEGTSVLPR